MKLLLAEDTKDLNRAISAILMHEGYDVDSVFDGEEAMEHLMKDSYDAIVLDIMMPKKSGLDVLKDIRSINLVTPVLLLTAKSEVDDRVAGLDAGADDYLTKPFAMKELLARVRSMTRRRTTYNSSELNFGDLKLNGDSFELASENAVRLSVKEFELMQFLILNADKELDSSYLLEHVWSGDDSANEDTLWLYISYLKGKLEAIDSEVDINGLKGGTFRLIHNS